MQMDHCWIAAEQISRTEYIMNYFHDMIDHIQLKRSLRDSINVYIGDCTFEIRAWAMRHVTVHEKIFLLLTFEHTMWQSRFHQAYDAILVQFD